MSPKPKRARGLIEVEAIIVAYAMSRLDETFLSQFAFKSWNEAFRSTGERLGIPPASMKNLRDEFDPIHPNTRKGWHKRPLRPNRQRVLGEFCDASDDAVLDVVRRLLGGDKEVEEMITAPIASERRKTENVAERLRTGRLAELYFMDNCESICGVRRNDLLDCRDQACGYDFGIEQRKAVAIEVKGLKALRGAVLFTDNEWNQAKVRAVDYWLVVIGSIQDSPRAKLIKHPASLLVANSVIRQVCAISWTAQVNVADSPL